jgi:hypothetical protein
LTGDPWDTFRRTLSGRFYVPHFIGDAAADLIFKLLQVGHADSIGWGGIGGGRREAGRGGGGGSTVPFYEAKTRLTAGPVFPI